MIKARRKRKRKNHKRRKHTFRGLYLQGKINLKGDLRAGSAREEKGSVLKKKKQNKREMNNIDAQKFRRE